MLISLQLVSTPQGPVADEPPRRFDEEMLTIGRAPNCHLVLPDGLRLVSRQHARIERLADGYQLSCLGASASVLVDEVEVPQGRSRPLHDGERVRIGGFELIVTIEEGAAPPGPLAAQEVDLLLQTDEPEPIDLPLQPALPDPTQVKSGRGRLDQWFDLEPAPPPAEPAATPALPAAKLAEPRSAPTPDPAPIPDLQELPDLMLPGDQAASSDTVQATELKQPGAAADSSVRPTGAAARPVPPALTDAMREELMAAFLEGAGLSGRTNTSTSKVMPPIHLTPSWMSHVGALLRASVDGALALLHSRSAVKREMRAEVTVIARRQNNPLKFAPDAAAALAHLIGPRRSSGFLDPVAAIQDAHEDLLVHHLAVVAGMRAAMFELIARTGPDAAMHDEGPPKGLAMTIPTLHEAALWRRHCQRHQALIARLDDDFEAVFGREFIKAYEAQARLVREQAPPEGPTG